MDNPLTPIAWHRAFVALLLVGLAACGAPADPPTPEASDEPRTASELVAEGRALWSTRRPGDLRSARDLFQRAIDLEPGLASAWSGLADASALLGLYSVEPAAVVMPQALRAADRALAIDDGNAATHASRGLALYLYEWSFPAAEEAFKRALDLDPHQVNAHHWFGMMLSVLGRHDEALTHMRAAAAGAAESALLATKIGTLQLTAGRLDEARATLTDARRRFPNSALPIRELGYVELAGGLPDAAVRYFLEALRVATPSAQDTPHHMVHFLEAGDPKLLVALALSMRRSGLQVTNGVTVGVEVNDNRLVHHDADDVVDAVRRRASTKPLSPVTNARLEIAAGVPEEALRWLDSGFQLRDPGMVYLRTKPSFEDLADNDDFLELCQRIGI